jgi:hypothetical protein
MRGVCVRGGKWVEGEGEDEMKTGMVVGVKRKGLS